MLDTNICVFVIRNKSSRIKNRLQQEIRDSGISVITLAELRYGADKSQHPATNHTALLKFVAPIEIADFDANATEHYGEIRADLENRGLPIGSLDMLIAAHARSINAIIVTNNTREFSRVKGLAIEDWSIP